MVIREKPDATPFEGHLSIYFFDSEVPLLEIANKN